MPDPDFSFLSNEQSNDVLAGIGAGLQSYDPNNMFAGAGAAISANTASRVKREDPYRQFQASLKNKKIFQDMYAGKKANITDFGRLTQNMKDMLKEMFGKARPVADVPPVDVVAEQMKAFYDENVRNEPLMKQSMENDPEWKRRGGVNNPPEDYSTARRPQSDEPNSGDDTQLEDLIRDVERESNPNSIYSNREYDDRYRMLLARWNPRFAASDRKSYEEALQTPEHRRPEPFPDEPDDFWSRLNKKPNDASENDYQSDQARDDSELQQLLQRMQAAKDGAVNEIEKQQILREGRDYLANQKKKRWALRTGKVGN
jgi:hypothetical protein